MNDTPSANAQPPAPQEARKGSGCASAVLRMLLVPAIVLVALLTVGAIYQAVATQADVRNYPPPGQLVDLGGYRLHIHCTGAGSPTVILESGAGEASPMWGWIQPQLATTTQVCAYDRAGFGWSDVGPEPRHAQQIVEELHLLLANGGIDPPYILAGHSLGGELIRLYTHQYPDEVKGLVFIDSSHPDQFERVPALQEEHAFGQQLSRAGALTAPFGLMRLYWGDAGPNPDLPAQQSAEMRAFFATAHPYRTQQAENAARPSTDAQVRATGHLGTVPIIVLSQDTTGDWLTLQSEISELSSNHQWRVVEDATHMSLLTDSQHASATSAAIQQLVEASR